MSIVNKVTNTIRESVNKLVDPVKLTLGTKGRTVLFNSVIEGGEKPQITKDGVTVANSIFSADQYENMIITVVREAAIKTMLSSGDGTTTTSILSQYLINHGLDLLNEGMSFYELKKNVDKALKDVIEFIEKNSIDVDKNPKLIKEIASISSNDEELGEFIYSIVEDLGFYGDIQVKESIFTQTHVDKTQGMKLHKGWYEAFMCNDTAQMKFVAKEVHILIFDEVIRSLNDFLPYLEYLKGKPLLVFCESISDVTLRQLKTFIETSGVPLCFVEHDGFKDRKELIMNDLAIVTGGFIVDNKDGFDPGCLGFAEEVIVEELYTSILGGRAAKNELNNLVKDIDDRLKLDEDKNYTVMSNRERKFQLRRRANLAGGIAVIHVGGATEMEMKELKDRYEDAVLAVTSAIKQGASIGGGYTYLNCQRALRNKNKHKAYQLVLDALEAPFKQLLINSDLINQYDEYKGNILKGKAFDLRTGNFYNVKKSSKLDSYKVYDASSVLIDSISNAIAVSKSLLSVKEIIYNGISLSAK